jgi:predicted transcriptional regulator YdeE
MNQTIALQTIEKDITTVYIQATSFPNGVLAAHQKLHALLDNKEKRQFYGISYPNTEGVIVYKAAATTLNVDEAKQLNLHTFVIKKGTYSSVFIENFMDDVQSIGRTFQSLLADSRIDPNGYCLEIYEGEKDVRCLVKLK